MFYLYTLYGYNLCHNVVNGIQSRNRLITPNDDDDDGDNDDDGVSLFGWND